MAGKSQISERTSVHLDLIRGVAALAVMFGHVRGLFFVEFPHLTHPSIITGILYALTGLGHQAVIVFFVLSGYFIGTSVWASVQARKWSWRTYLANRLTRLELVLIPALMLGALWDQIGLRLPQAASLYYGGLANYYAPSVALRSTIPALFGNLFFLQSIVSPVFGSNGPLWSLSYEFWYYILCPLLMLGAFAWKGFRARLAYMILAMAVLVFVGPQISLYFLIWAAGAAVGHLHARESAAAGAMRTPALDAAPSNSPETVRGESVHHKSWFSRSITGLTVASGFLFAGSLAWNRVHPIASATLADAVIGACFAIWLFILIHSTGGGVSPIYSRVAKTLAGFSYTLYLTHFPVVLLVRAWLNPRGNWMPDPLHCAYALIIAALVLGYAYAVSQVTEARTDVVRRRILQPWVPSPKEAAR